MDFFGRSMLLNIGILEFSSFHIINQLQISKIAQPISNCVITMQKQITKYFATEQEVMIDVIDLFRFYNTYFFNDILDSSVVKWSTRMTLCAGTCKYQGFRSCTITLSEPLLKYRSSNQLKQTLLHEMIHAYLFITNPQACKVNGGHGKQFQQLMNNINSITKLKLTIYHNFQDQVNNCRKHVWRCEGKCKQIPPFFGYVRRAMNRQPQKADWWFQQHKKECGGEFKKISGPQKKSKSKSKQKQKGQGKEKGKRKSKQKYVHKGKTIDQYVKIYQQQEKSQRKLKQSKKI